MSDELLSKLPKLTTISKYGVGLDMLDLNAIQKRGIRLGWTGGTNSRAVSELIIAEILNLLRNLNDHHDSTKRGLWTPVAGDQLSGKTVGIIGCGQVGQDLAKLLRSFECKVLAFDKRCLTSFYKTHQVTPTELNTLLGSADIVTIHVPLTSETENLIGHNQLNLMKPSAILLNAARGGIVNERALELALTNGVIRGAALDVFEIEPTNQRRLLTLDNFLCTPHIGGSTHEAVLAMGRAAIEGLDSNTVPTDHFVSEHS